MNLEGRRVVGSQKDEDWLLYLDRRMKHAQLFVELFYFLHYLQSVFQGHLEV